MRLVMMQEHQQHPTEITDVEYFVSRGDQVHIPQTDQTFTAVEYVHAYEE